MRWNSGSNAASKRAATRGIKSLPKLEAVAATIENLGADDRMVGIVTHVPELAARMPVQFRVHKGARTSSVERIDG